MRQMVRLYPEIHGVSGAECEGGFELGARGIGLVAVHYDLELHSDGLH